MGFTRSEVLAVIWESIDPSWTTIFKEYSFSFSFEVCKLILSQGLQELGLDSLNFLKQQSCSSHLIAPFFAIMDSRLNFWPCEKIPMLIYADAHYMLITMVYAMFPKLVFINIPQHLITLPLLPNPCSPPGRLPPGQSRARCPLSPHLKQPDEVNMINDKGKLSIRGFFPCD